MSTNIVSPMSATRAPTQPSLRMMNLAILLQQARAKKACLAGGSGSAKAEPSSQARASIRPSEGLKILGGRVILFKRYGYPETEFNE